MPDLYDRSFLVEGGTLDVLAELDIEGKSVVLDDIVIFPRGADRLVVGAAGVVRLRQTISAEFRAMGFDTLVIRGTRLSGANPGHKVEIRIDLTEATT